MCPIRRFIVAEVESGPSGEEQCDGLPRRVVIELLCQLERQSEPGGGIGEIPLGVGSEPDEQLCEHADEGRFLQIQVAGEVGDRYGSLPVARVGRGEPGDVEQLKGSPAVARRHLGCRAKEKLARVGRHAAGHLDETEEAVEVRTLDRLRHQPARPLEQHQGAFDAPREPGCLRGRGESPCPVLLVRCQCGRPLESERGRGETAPPPRTLCGRLELLTDGRVRLDARRGAVPGAAICIDLAVEDPRERAVDGLSPGERRRLVDGRTDKWMAKLEPRSADV